MIVSKLHRRTAAIDWEIDDFLLKILYKNGSLMRYNRLAVHVFHTYFS